MKKKQNKLLTKFRSAIKQDNVHPVEQNDVHPVDINSHDPDKVFPSYLKDPKFPFFPISAKTFNPVNQPILEQVANQYEWMQGDDKINFEKNKNKAGSNWKYLTKPVTYTVNSSGYRAPEWDQIDWKNSIVLLGCSCTYGIGISDEETISYHLEKLSGRPVINLGIPGGSNILILNNAARILEYFTAPYAVAHIWSTTDRFEFYETKSPHHAGPWDRHGETINKYTNISQLWKLTYADPSHEMGLTYNEAQIGKWLWAGRSKYSSISFFPSTVNFANAEKHFVIDNGARDLIHPGEENSKQVANYLHKRFQ